MRRFEVWKILDDAGVSHAAPELLGIKPVEWRRWLNSTDEVPVATRLGLRVIEKSVDRARAVEPAFDEMLAIADERVRIEEERKRAEYEERERRKAERAQDQGPGIIGVRTLYCDGRWRYFAATQRRYDSVWANTRAEKKTKAGKGIPKGAGNSWCWMPMEYVTEGEAVRHRALATEDEWAAWCAEHGLPPRIWAGWMEAMPPYGWKRSGAPSCDDAMFTHQMGHYALPARMPPPGYDGPETFGYGVTQEEIDAGYGTDEARARVRNDVNYWI